MNPQTKKDAGHRETRSVVAVQFDCAFPVRLRARGNNGDGRTIFATSRMRLSQKMSSAFVLAIGAARGFLAFAPSGMTRLEVLKPASLTSISDGPVPICNSTRR